MSTIAQNAKAIFLEAVERHSPERWPKFLDEACAGDVELRQQVEGLLQAHQERDSLFDAEPTADAPIAESPGTTIGHYKLLQEIGEGGMGTVFMAEQTEPVKRDNRDAIIHAEPFDQSSQFLAKRGIAELRGGDPLEAIELFRKAQTLLHEEFTGNSARNLRNKVCVVSDRVRRFGASGRRDYASGILADLPEWLKRREEVQTPKPQVLCALEQYLGWYDKLVLGRLLLYTALAHQQAGETEKALEAYEEAVSSLLCQPTVDELTLIVWAEITLAIEAKKAESKD